MPDPLHMATFATKAEISAYNFSLWPDGTPVFCKETGSWFVLDKTSTTTADNNNVLTSVTGRFLKNIGRGQVNTATSLPSSSPSFIGESLIVTLDGGTITERTINFIAKGTSSSSDWVAVGGSSITADDSPSYYGISPVYPGEIYVDSYTPAVYIAANAGSGLDWYNLNVVGGS